MRAAEMSTTIQDHSLSWTLANAADRLKTYRRVLSVNIVLDTLIGLAALTSPGWLARLLGQPEPYPDAWLQAFGLMLIAANVLYLPAWKHPTSYRWPNWAGIVIRLALALLLLAQGRIFLLFALWEAFWGIVLLVTYYRLAQADLLRRP
jgi:hypothetical protein